MTADGALPIEIRLTSVPLGCSNFDQSPPRIAHADVRDRERAAGRERARNRPVPAAEHRSGAERRAGDHDAATGQYRSGAPLHDGLPHMRADARDFASLAGALVSRPPDERALAIGNQQAIA